MKPSTKRIYQLISSVVILTLTLAACIGCGGTPKSTLPPVSDQVRHGDSVSTSELPIAEESTQDSLSRVPSGWVIKDLINVRSKASTSSDVVAQLPRGAEVKLVEYTDKWWKVLLTDGRTAYVYEPLITKERYVDPWTRFKFEASRISPELKIISGVAGIDGEAPSAAFSVSWDEWSGLTPESRSNIARLAYDFWTVCVGKCGYDPAKSVVIFRDESNKELARVISADGKAAVTLSE